MTSELIFYLMSWAAFYTNYSLPDELPIIQVTEHEWFVEQLCDGVDSRHKPCAVRGAYDDAEPDIIRINRKYYDKMNNHWEGVLIHELTHYLQKKSGMWEEMDAWGDRILCLERIDREREAYHAQRTYMEDVHDEQLIKRNRFDRCEGK